MIPLAARNEKRGFRLSGETLSPGVEVSRPGVEGVDRGDEATGLREKGRELNCGGRGVLIEKSEAIAQPQSGGRLMLLNLT